MTAEQKCNLRSLIEHYGHAHQQIKAIEEMAELIQELSKFDGENLKKIIDELADVEVMVEQLKIIFDCHEEIEERINFKINRQLERMSRGE